MTNQRVEVITSVERRRRWSEAEKQAILADIGVGSGANPGLRQAWCTAGGGNGRWTAWQCLRPHCGAVAWMAEARDPLPDDKDALKAALIETRARLLGAEALIEHLQLVIAKMKREKFGPRSERSQRLLDQLASSTSFLKKREVQGPCSMISVGGLISPICYPFSESMTVLFNESRVLISYSGQGLGRIK
jgi:hypothetical protein